MIELSPDTEVFGLVGTETAREIRWAVADVWKLRTQGRTPVVKTPMTDFLRKLLTDSDLARSELSADLYVRPVAVVYAFTPLYEPLCPGPAVTHLIMMVNEPFLGTDCEERRYWLWTKAQRIPVTLLVREEDPCVEGLRMTVVPKPEESWQEYSTVIIACRFCGYRFQSNESILAADRTLTCPACQRDGCHMLDFEPFGDTRIDGTQD